MTTSRPQSARAFRALLFAAASAVFASSGASASSDKTYHGHSNLCEQTHESALRADALECFKLEIDLSQFNLETARGIDAAGKHLLQLSHRACRIRNPNPSPTDYRIYEDCKSNIMRSASDHYGLTVHGTDWVSD